MGEVNDFVEYPELLEWQREVLQAILDGGRVMLNPPRRAGRSLAWKEIESLVTVAKALEDDDE